MNKITDSYENTRLKFFNLLRNLSNMHLIKAGTPRPLPIYKEGNNAKTLLLNLLLACSVLGCESEDLSKPITEEKVPPVPVEVIVANKVDTPIKLNLYGRLEPSHSILVSSDFTAPVAAVYVSEYESVEVGQPLLRFDMTKLELRRDQIKSQLEGAFDEQDFAIKNRNRILNLLGSDSVAQSQFDHANKAVTSAISVVEVLENQLRLIEQDLKHEELISPITGSIYKKYISEGEQSNAFKPLFQIDSTTDLKFSTYVSAIQFQSINESSEANVKLNDVLMQASIDSISNQSDPLTGNYAIKLSIDNSDPTLRSGMTGIAQITSERSNKHLLIPNSALVSGPEGFSVYKFENGLARKQKVIIGMIFSEQVEVISGLFHGEKIVSQGIEFLIDGSPVEIIENE